MVAFIGIQHPRLVEYITVRPRDIPPTALGISARTTQGSMWGQSPFPCPLHTNFVKETRRDGSSLKACFVFQAMQKVSGRNCLHYTIGLSLNQIGCFISLFSHFLAYEHSREKKSSVMDWINLWDSFFPGTANLECELHFFFCTVAQIFISFQRFHNISEG